MLVLREHGREAEEAAAGEVPAVRLEDLLGELAGALVRLRRDVVVVVLGEVRVDLTTRYTGGRLWAGENVLHDVLGDVLDGSGGGGQVLRPPGLPSRLWEHRLQDTAQFSGRVVHQPRCHGLGLAVGDR